MAQIRTRKSANARALDPVTFEILRNSFSNSVELMAQQFRLTCHSFVIYAQDFSCGLADANGDTVSQGEQDIAVQVGTQHLVCKNIIEEYQSDIHPGDVFVSNDPYAGGTHFNDVRVLRPIFAGDDLIAWAMANGHWSDVGGSVPGSFDVRAREHFGEGLRISPVRVWSRGDFLSDVAKLIVGNTRAPEDNLSDLNSQAEATRVCEREILRLVGRYGKGVITLAFSEVIAHVAALFRSRIAELEDGTWTTSDYLDSDPAHGEGMIPITVSLTIKGDQLSYDLSKSSPAVASFMNSAAGATLSGIIAGTKRFFPDIPINAGLINSINVELGPVGSVINAAWPTAVSGFVSGSFEKVISAIFELWSQIMPERAIACSFNLEYLLIGGRDVRLAERPIFMWYDWMVGGWGARNGFDGASAASALFGAGFASQPIEGQERLNPVVTTHCRIVADSGGPGEFRGGCGVEKGGQLTDAELTIMSYCCDRSRSIPWGVSGGLPATPQGLWMNPDSPRAEYLGAVFSNVELVSGDAFSRPSSGGGGFGDPLNRDLQAVLDDVIDGYVTTSRAGLDYGVIINSADPTIHNWIVDSDATLSKREYIRQNRHTWLAEDAEVIARRYRSGELSQLDLIRQYGVIVEWGTGELLVNTTKQHRELLRQRAATSWAH
ncbi:MAG: methylhydantoinase [Actinobacteria bacterium]|nr:MAG: methylhydantoinase [Actinomycetota bacterium]